MSAPAAPPQRNARWQGAAALLFRNYSPPGCKERKAKEKNFGAFALNCQRTCIGAFFLLLASLSLSGCGQNDALLPTATAADLSSPPPTPLVTPTSPASATSLSSSRRYFDSPEYGVQAFLWWKPDTAQRDLQLVQEMGFGWVKQTFAWRDIEAITKGEYDWWRPDYIVQAVEEAGLQLLVRLDRQPFWTQPPGTPPLENMPPANLQDYGDFCGAVASRYRGRIAAYQVWNEPNLSREWGNQPPDPVAYTALLRVCYEAIKAADAAAIVISAGMAPTGTGLPTAIPDTEFLQSMYAAGAEPYFDVLGVNAPGYQAAPELSPEEGEALYGHRFFVFRRVEDMRAIMVAQGDADKQVAVLEMGWTLDPIRPEYAWFAVDESTQADYLVRAYQYAEANWQPWIGLMTTIYIAEYHWTPEANEEYWWAIVLPDGTPRAAYYALQEMPK